MKYVLHSPAEEPGLYIISNPDTQYKYVGATSNLSRRYNQWRGYLTRDGRVVKRMEEFAPEADKNKWEFEVLAIMPDANMKQLMIAETKAIAAVVKATKGKVLNTYMRSYLTIPGDTTILSDNGEPIPYDDAVEMTGYSKQSMLQMLGRLRKKGVTEVNVSDLKNPGRGRPKITY